MRIGFHFHFLAILIRCILSKDKYIKIDYFDKNYKICVKGFVGIPYIPVDLEISQSKNFSFLTIPQYSLGEKTKTFSSKEMFYKENKIQITEVQDLFKIDENHPHIDLHFYYYNNTFGDETDYPSFLSLSYSSESSEFSFLYQLYKNLLIDKVTYTFVPFNRTNGEIIFGKLPDYYIKDKKKLSCIFDEKGEMQGKWSCRLKMLKVNGYSGSYVLSSSFIQYFDINHKRYNFPLYFLEYLKLTMFKPYIEKGVCKFKTTMIFKYFYCFCDQIIDFPAMTIYLDGAEFLLDKNHLFSQARNNRCNFNIINDNRFKGEDDWIFGRLFLEKFISTFDYETKEISFYFEALEIEDIIRSFKLFLFSSLLVLIFGISFLSYVKFKVKK